MMKKLLFLVFTLLLFTQNIFSDCTACWELKYVTITTKQNKEITGFIKWNRAWYANIWTQGLKIPDKFPDDYYYYFSQWENGVSEVLIIKVINSMQLNKKEKIYYALNSDTIIINYAEIKEIKKINHEPDNIHGAGELTILNQEFKDILKSKPYNYKMIDDGGCEFYFLNYNLKIEKEKFDSMVNWSNINKKTTLENDSIFIIKSCYD
ncbi:hypothetical protein ACE01N_18345 [Saccharicrinis sp. FJH2]|uniref:hypothetical protein n=1 Tax=Saccharicrinis sp. FJH65 TaxID=3344659 RepID=UPI0035F41895